jgi:hypothetical protein
MSENFICTYRKCDIHVTFASHGELEGIKAFLSIGKPKTQLKDGTLSGETDLSHLQLTAAHLSQICMEVFAYSLYLQTCIFTE